MDDVLGFVYERLYGTEKTLKFSQIIPSDKREDKILTFIPLLHLSNARKVDLTQEEDFADFEVGLAKEDTSINENLDEESEV